MTIRNEERKQSREAPGQQHLGSGRRLLLALALILLLATGIGTLTFIIVRAINPAWMASVDFVVLLVAEVYASVLAALLLAFGGWAGVRERLAFRYTGRRNLLLSLGALVLGWIVVGLVNVFLSPKPGGSPQSILLQVLPVSPDLPRLSSADVLATGLIAIRACVLSPLGEELVFRGALFGWVRRHLPALPTILLTAVIFAPIHTSVPFSLIRELPGYLTISLEGIILAWVRERTGSSLNTFVMHAINNSLALIVAYVLVALQITR